jgi:hypothetical protein
LVILSSFVSVARAQAYWHVTKHDIKQLKKTLDNSELREIRSGLESVTFFFFTQAQLRANETSGTRESFTQVCAQLIAPYDEFGYLAKRRIAVYFNSKENFDTVYKGQLVLLRQGPLTDRRMQTIAAGYSSVSRGPRAAQSDR